MRECRIIINHFDKGELCVMKMDKIMKQAQKMQAQMMKIQEELAQERVEGNAGGGMVTVVANGHGDIVSVKIEKEVVNPDDIEMLEDLVLAAVSDALKNSRELANARMGQVSGALGALGLM
ncbi:MAG: YbaB/EbfC family nucleoid-associated protein [Aminobacterium sp.]|nr:YbaB/EbfC family nucleoid-associated protein [Aminobacterium sp.]